MKNQMKKMFKQDKGQAGLTILLSVIVSLFIIGLLVAIFNLMTSEVIDQDMLYQRTGSYTVTTESLTPTMAGVQFAEGVHRGALCSLVANSVINGTGATPLTIRSGNYTVENCIIKNKTSEFTTAVWKVNYTYTYLADTQGTAQSFNDTGQAVAGVTDWFDIFIVITAMVVLILLTVIIITSIRSSGMIAGGTSGANSVGTA